LRGISGGSPLFARRRGAAEYAANSTLATGHYGSEGCGVAAGTALRQSYMVSPSPKFASDSAGKQVYGLQSATGASGS